MKRYICEEKREHEHEREFTVTGVIVSAQVVSTTMGGQLEEWKGKGASNTSLSGLGQHEATRRGWHVGREEKKV